MASTRSTSLLWYVSYLVSAWCGSYVEANNCQASSGVLNLVVSEVHPSWTLLEWQHSVSAASCAEHYTVSWCVLSSRWSTNCEPSTSDVPLNTTSYNVTGLKPCSFYRVAVTTVAKDGNLTQVADVIVTPAENVGRVRHLDVTVSGDQLAVAWDPPAGGDACISRYQVCWRTQGNHNNCSWTEPTIWLGGEVEYCASYNVSVKAQDVTNMTSETVTKSIYTGTEKVQNIAAVDVTPHSILLSWNSSDSSASCTSGYNVTWCTLDHYTDTCLEPVKVAKLTGDKECNITDLRQCHEYRIFVTATSDDGSESDAALIAVKTSLKELKPPQNISTTVINSKLTFVDFSPDEDSWLCTTKYMGCPQDDDEPDASPVCVPAPNNQYWATWDSNTEPCSEYSLQITAIGTDNSSVSSMLVNFTSGAADVSDLQVMNATANSSESSAMLSWKVPALNKCVLYQQVTWTAKADDLSHSSNISNSAMEFILQDLEPCTQYEVGLEQKTDGPSSISTLNFISGSNVTSVTDLTVAETIQDSLIISFFAPEASPACVANYTVCWRATNGDHQRNCVTLETSGPSSVNISFLNSCTNYTVDVTPVGPDKKLYSQSSIVATTTGCPNSAAIASTMSTIAWSLLLFATLYLRATQQ